MKKALVTIGLMVLISTFLVNSAESENIIERAKKNLTRAKMENNGACAVGSLMAIAMNCRIYENRIGYYPQNLAAGNKTFDSPIFDSELVGGEKDGYKFAYKVTKEGYSVVASPVILGTTGMKRYFLDETGIIRVTHDGSEPSINSEVEIDASDLAK